MGRIVVRPGRLSQFGSSEGATFCLVANPGIADEITIERDGDYVDYQLALFAEGDQFEDLLASLPQHSHVLVISPDVFFASPSPAALGGDRKLLGMACNSTPTTPEIISYFLGVLERTSAAEQDAFADRFFDLAETADHLVYVDEKYRTRATLDHAAPDLVWNQQAGGLDWGMQQIVPPGEISVLPAEITDFDYNLSLPLNGTIAIAGYPILHAKPRSALREDQARVHDRLCPMMEHGVIATIDNGHIVDMRPGDAEAADVLRTLELMMELDSRYRLLWEIGHALNTSLWLLPGNHAMNEVYGSVSGCLHYGIGLTTDTQYHLDVVAPGTRVYTPSGELLLGSKEPVPMRMAPALAA